MIGITTLFSWRCSRCLPVLFFAFTCWRTVGWWCIIIIWLMSQWWLYIYNKNNTNIVLCIFLFSFRATREISSRLLVDDHLSSNRYIPSWQVMRRLDRKICLVQCGIPCSLLSYLGHCQWENFKLNITQIKNYFLSKPHLFNTGCDLNPGRHRRWRGFTSLTIRLQWETLY